MAGGQWCSADCDRASVVEAEILVVALLDDGVLGALDRSRGEHLAEGRELLEQLTVLGEEVPEDHRVGPERLIGGIEGKGLSQTLAALELGRINVAARGVGVAQAALDEALRYSQIRKTFGKPICEHQAIQIKLADMATRTEAARLLTNAAAEAYDRGGRTSLETSMAKLFASEAAVENSLEAMRVHGGYGYSKEFPVERLYRDAPLLVIGEGTSEVQRLVIARQLIERNPV